MTAKPTSRDISVGDVVADALHVVQRRVLVTLSAAQIVGGVGVAIGLTLSALTVAELSGSEAVAGLAGTASVLGAALLALPTARAAARRGRRAGLAMAYCVALAGGLGSVLAISLGSWPLLLVALVLLGGGSAGNLAARYAATDLSPGGHAARHLSLVVWAATIGSVTGPNLAAPASRVGLDLGLPDAAGPFAFAAGAFAVALVVITVGLRPDPLVLARRAAAAAPTHGPAERVSAETDRADAASVSARPVDSTYGATSTADPVTAPVADAAPASGAAPAGNAVDGRAVDGRAVDGRARTRTVHDAWQVLRAVPAARLAITAIAVSHTAMVSVMSMTPVHLGHGGAAISVIGMVISLHIAGMYVLSPLVGWLADRVGRVRVLVLGMAQLLAASLLAGTAGEHGVAQVTAGLILLGTGWSCGLVAGSAMLTEAVPIARRPAVQGLSDMLMNVCGATGTVIAGLIVDRLSYGLLGVAVAVLVSLCGARLLFRDSGTAGRRAAAG